MLELAAGDGASVPVPDVIDSYEVRTIDDPGGGGLEETFESRLGELSLSSRSGTN